jgi:hypothetical protein
VALLIAEVLFVLAVAVGVGMYSLPAGVIVGGVLGVLACEVASARQRRAGPETASAGGPPR